MIRHERWTGVRKHLAMEAIDRGEFTRADFMAENRISEEEMQQWERGRQVNELRVSGRCGGTRAVKKRAGL